MVFSIMDKQFKGDLQMLSFNELAAGLCAEYPQLTFYLAPRSPQLRPAVLPLGSEAPSTHYVMSQLPRTQPAGVEGVNIITQAGFWPGQQA